MRFKHIAAIFIITLLVFVLIIYNSIIKRNGAYVASIPSLPMPIATEYALITSAGQSTDVYIINDIANKLMIHNFFMPQAKSEDLDNINTLVFVVGHSNIGEKLHGIDYEQEKQRIEELIAEAKERELVVLTVFLGGKQQLDQEAKELLNIISTKTDYLIGTREANSSGFLSDLAKSRRIPFTLVKEVNDLSEPFASAFR